MVKPRACKICKRVHESEKCTDCDSKEFTESFKGRIMVLNPEESEIAQKIGIKEKGEFAIKTR